MVTTYLNVVLPILTFSIIAAGVNRQKYNSANDNTTAKVGKSKKCRFDYETIRRTSLIGLSFKTKIEIS
ncbi:MAG: hypothetical protein FWE67_07490 [Planctomycetaceae bacterium]|nr:hypothetical protein [Planctomycetaceae bacterium]